MLQGMYGEANGEVASVEQGSPNTQPPVRQTNVGMYNTSKHHFPSLWIYHPLPHGDYRLASAHGRLGSVPHEGRRWKICEMGPWG
jgi:hypothetical protein